MLRALEVARLTRPSRISRRPVLAFRPLKARSIVFTANRLKPPAAALAQPLDTAQQDGYQEDPSVLRRGARKEEWDDYEQALAMQKELLDTSKPRIVRSRNTNLPSLRNRKTFGPTRAPANGSSSSDAGSQAGESSTSGAARVETRKGKEKAANQEGRLEDYGRHIAKVKGLRRNPVGVQLLSDSLHRQLFPGESLPKPPDRLLDISKTHLKDNGLSPESAAVLSEIDFKMPPLRGQNIRDHFHALGEHTAEPYLSMAKEFMRAELPPMPRKWETNRSGWTKYHVDGKREAVDDLGEERIVSFDVETLYKLSPFPVMATAVTPNGWYSWLSPTIFDDPPGDTSDPLPPWKTRTPSHHPHDLIPLFKGSTPRVVIGHNVGYDRARVKEEYSLERTSTRWLDTLSLHVATRGITSVQRPAWMAHRKNKRAKALRDQESLLAFQELAEENADSEMLEGLQEWGVSNENETDALQNQWQDVTSVNSLAEVASLHCGIPVDKSIRNRFGEEQITHASQLRAELQDLLTYCGGDVRITHEVYKKVLPLFLESCPHPASFSGVLSMGNSFLPVDENWEKYLENAESKYREMDEGVKKALRVLAEKVKTDGLKEGDPWSTQLDWSPKSARWADDTASDIIPDSKVNATDPSAATSLINNPNEQPTTGEYTSPAWLVPFESDRSLLASTHTQRYLLPLLLRMSYKGHPVAYLADHHWCFVVPHDQLTEYIEVHGAPVELNHKKDKRLEPLEEKHAFFRIGRPGESRKSKLSGPSIKPLIQKGELSSPYRHILKDVTNSKLEGLVDEIWKCAQELRQLGEDNPWGRQLDWTPKSSEDVSSEACAPPSSSPSSNSITRPDTTVSPRNKTKSSKSDFGTWPKWYWDLTGPPSRIPPGELDLTFKKTVAPLLLRLQWQGYPLIHSRAHKWLYRVPRDIIDNGGKDAMLSRGGRVRFDDRSGVDAIYADDREHYYFRLPHKDGEGKNVGNPLSKHFVKSIESGELASAAADSGDDVAAKAATDATNMNAFCSYWISSRERIMDQMVVYQSPTSGMILPQVITMGTVTRRAVEGTWLTASNAKKNRVGSELKAMVRAPPGYAIVGADVDSEELWISSVMGDSQFGMYGATAIGWMTLEGTKSAGTDLHSKTADILGISRDAAKVFNYSRIYGAGKKHAVQLLLQGDSKLTKETAGRLADNLYRATKGSKSTRSKDKAPAAIPSIWHGGSESYLFNTLEAIALSDRPTTPALGCGITKALRKSYLEEGSSYLPSRVNWVVQSSGVDYLHLLIVSMEYLLSKYKIDARYLISVHDEVRYLAKEEDKYRTALALQIANAWTRALFCYNLGMDDMPQGIAFFSAVDVDHVLRKEVFMTCETPSHPTSIPAGESLDIDQLLAKTGGGKLGTPIKDDLADYNPPLVNKQPVSLFPDIQSAEHQLFLEAQAAKTGKLAKLYLDGLPDVVGSVEEAEKRGYKPSVRRAVASAKGA
ncbi:hypothetical protein IAU59_005581 [Kwoniella sp. CBS 9459]